MKATYTLMLGEGDAAEEIDVEFEIQADITYQPARISGPPEDCYPDESECEITSIRVMDTVEGHTDAEILKALEVQVGEDRIVEDLWDDYSASRDDAAADAADHYNDDRSR